MPPLRRTMLLDPPWNETGGGKSKRGADKHYGVTTTPNILKVIMQSGMWTPNPSCCSVWMWATANFLGEAHWLMQRLGAVYVTNIVWVKAETETLYRKVVQKRSKETADNVIGAEFEILEPVDAVIPQAPGLGQRLRMCHEHLLYGRVGRVPVPATPDRLPSTIYAPRGRHSAKPDEAFRRIETHDGTGSRLEFFARTKREGWDAFGNEV